MALLRVESLVCQRKPRGRNTKNRTGIVLEYKYSLGCLVLIVSHYPRLSVFPIPPSLSRLFLCVVPHCMLKGGKMIYGPCNSGIRNTIQSSLALTEWHGHASYVSGNPMNPLTHLWPCLAFFSIPWLTCTRACMCLAPCKLHFTPNDWESRLASSFVGWAAWRQESGLGGTCRAGKAKGGWSSCDRFFHPPSSVPEASRAVGAIFR